MSKIYQHSTLAALMAKQMQGTTTIGDLLTHGDTGIGTLAGVDGEVIILDGDVYQADEFGKVNHITDMQTTLPFATVHFASDVAQNIDVAATDFAGLADLQDVYHFTNNFAALRLHGQFEHVLVRAAPKSEVPYPSLLEVSKKQPTFTADQVSGTIVGYFSPSLYQGTVAAGWHLHFLSDDHTFGGHLLEVQTQQVTGTLESFSDFQLHLPIEDQSFRDHNADVDDLDAGIKAAEGGH
ncbi:acetolactate decarboxylase [Weissella uvarum]|uniref:acetolactate decarboxylase n=1 Tax=Weissella uvarum TaxID=1479233 RepID=UPI00195F552C|nr:acetolactate decarboxylase [Weissella uvarum]MBM7616662.1 acetolactate decarboxylase [Weissella uvarum]MCM0594880.1 acetolactate decarboxylase [Weissella uvarum]